jgi:hypothetical protein
MSSTTPAAPWPLHMRFLLLPGVGVYWHIFPSTLVTSWGHIVITLAKTTAAPLLRQQVLLGPRRNKSGEALPTAMQP